MDLYILRHGDTIETSSLYSRIFGHRHDSHDIEILPKAVPALKKIGEYLKNVPTDANFTSPYSRCVNSSKIVGDAAGKTFQTDDRLAELEKNGESFPAFRDRVGSFLDEINQKNYSAVSICTHGAVITALEKLATKGTLYFYQIFFYPNPGELLIIKNGKVSKIDFNK